MKKADFILIFFGTFLLSCQTTFAQDNRWLFIGSNVNGSTSYLEKSALKETGDRKRTWVQDVFSDGSYKIVLIDWQCRDRRFRFIESINYAPSGAFIDKRGISEWMSVVPDSVSENYYKVVCNLPEKTATVSPESKMIALIIARNANVRESPTTDSRVTQKVAKGARLFLVDGKLSGGWYQVFVDETKQMGWLHGNTIKLLAVKSNANQPKQKSKSVGQRRRTN